MMDLQMYYTVNMAVVNYFGTQMPEIENIDGRMKIESADMHEKDLTDPVILTVKNLQMESYEDEVMIEYTLANPIPLKDVVECVINDEKVHLTKEDLALSNT